MLMGTLHSPGVFGNAPPSPAGEDPVSSPLAPPSRASGPRRAPASRAARQRRRVCAAIQDYALLSCSPDLALAALYLADDDGRELGHSSICHEGVMQHLIASLKSELRYLQDNPPGPRGVALLAGEIGHLAGLLARTAASLVAAAEAANPPLPTLAKAAPSAGGVR